MPIEQLHSSDIKYETSMANKPVSIEPMSVSNSHHAMLQKALTQFLPQKLPQPMFSKIRSSAQMKSQILDCYY